MGSFRFIGKVHHDLTAKPFMVMDYSTVRTMLKHIHPPWIYMPVS